MTGFLCYVLGASSMLVGSLLIARRDDRRRQARRPIGDRFASGRSWQR